MPERIDFWGIPATWGPPQLLVYALMGMSGIVLVFRLYLKASLWWQVGRPAACWSRPHVRLARVLQYAIVQTRILGERYPGLMHVAIAWSFLVFFFGTALATVDSHFIKFLRGETFLVYKLALDLFVAFFLLGAAMAAYRRFVSGRAA